MNILTKIQSELKAPKNQRNDFGGYAYRSCEDILEGLKPFLKDNEATITISDKITEAGGRVYVTATATLKGLDFEESVSAFAREPVAQKGMNDAQITGSASSYARKYALNGLFAIDDSKDADYIEKHGKDTKQKSNKPVETKKWYNEFNKHKEAYTKKIADGELTTEGIIKSLEEKGYSISAKTKEDIKSLK